MKKKLIELKAVAKAFDDDLDDDDDDDIVGRLANL